MVKSQVTSIRKRPSNSSTTGIVSMPMSAMWRKFTTQITQATHEANVLAESVDHYVDLFSRGMSRRYTTQFAGQTSSRPSLLVQSRNSRLVSKVPKTAIWILVSANLLFIVLALGLTGFALAASSADVYQVYTRLGVAGLAAQLFEGSYARRVVKNNEELFGEHAEAEDKIIKRVGVERREEGGTELVLLESRAT